MTTTDDGERSQSEQAPGGEPYPFLAGGGEMGARMRSLDWSQTALGPPAQWPQSLRTAVGICLECRFPIAVFWGPGFTHLYNDEYRAILGSKHPALGREGAQVWPEIWSTVGAMLEQVTHTGEATRARDLLLPVARRTSGAIEDCWFSFSYSPIVDEQGRVAGVFCPVIETTETIKAQRRLQDDGGRLKTLFEQAPSFIAVLDGPEHVFVLANDSYQHAFGPRELVGRRVRDAFPELEGQGFFELLDHVFASGKAVTLNEASAQIRPAGKDRPEERYVDMVYQPIRNADASVAGIFVQGIDVTARKHAERRDAFLLRVDDRTRALSDADQIAAITMQLLCDELAADRVTYFEVDPDARTATVVSDYAPRIVSLAGRRLCIDDFGGAFSSAMRSDRPLVLDTAAEADLTPEQMARFQAIQIDAVIIIPLHKDDELIAMVGVYQGTPRRWRPREVELVHLVVNRCWESIGRARAARGLREADRRKDEFIATLAHELRNPLAPIRSGLAVLGRAHGGGAHAGLLEIMERQVEHLVHMIDDLLDVSRITQGKIALRLDQVDLVEAVLHALDAARSPLESAGHRLTVDLAAQPVAVRGDPVRLTQVFANLLNNAIKYTPAGGSIAISVRVEGDVAVAEIADDGVGIEPALQGRVFEIFAQISDGPYRTDRGLGIGLSLVRDLVQLHGGTVSVYSGGINQGSTFSVRLPLHRDAVPAPATQEDPPLVPPSSAPRVLVVDDDRDVADALAASMSALGADVRIAYDGHRALQLVGTDPPSVVFVDIGMPRMNGLEVARRIRAQAGGRAIVLVALTGWGQDEDRAASRRSGFDHHLVKPVSLETLEGLLLDVRRAGS